MDFLNQITANFKSVKFPIADGENAIYKTGTTCIAFIFDKGVILASERKVSVPQMGQVWLGDKKISAITNNVSLGGAGTAIGLQLMTQKVLPMVARYYQNSSNRQIALEQIKSYITYALLQEGLHQFNTWYVLAGINKNNKKIYSFDGIGATTEHTTYYGIGSGYKYASAILDLEHSNDMSEEDAVKLAQKAVASSKRLDLYSGYYTDIHVIKQEGTDIKVIKNYTE